MTNNEMLNLINSVSKTELSKLLGLSRQAIYNKIKEEKDLEKLYNIAVIIKNHGEKQVIDSIEAYKLDNADLRKEINNYRDKNKILKNRIDTLEKEILKYKKPNEDYQNLLHRYRNLQSILFTYYKLYGGLNNDFERNK